MISKDSDAIAKILADRREGFIAKMSDAFDHAMEKLPAQVEEESRIEQVDNSADPRAIERISNLEYLK